MIGTIHFPKIIMLHLRRSEQSIIGACNCFVNRHECVWCMCRLSMVTQRMVNTERQLRLQAEAAASAKAEEVERLKGELTVLQVRRPTCSMCS